MLLLKKSENMAQGQLMDKGVLVSQGGMWDPSPQLRLCLTTPFVSSRQLSSFFTWIYFISEEVRVFFQEDHNRKKGV